jgi:hypothetical protein
LRSAVLRIVLDHGWMRGIVTQEGPPDPHRRIGFAQKPAHSDIGL